MSQGISVYGRPGCVQCKYTVKEFENINVPIDYIDISVNEVAAEHIKSLGFSTLPVVDTGTENWAGLKVDRIRAYRKTD